MDFRAPTNAIITFPFEGELADETREKGCATVVLHNITTQVGDVVGEITVVSDSETEPITVSLVIAESSNGGGGSD